MAARRDKTAEPAVGYNFDRLPSGRSRFVSAYFTKLDDAVAAARDLEDRGYDRDRIGVFMSTERRRHYLETRPEFDEDGRARVVAEDVELEKSSRTLEGAGAGGAIGGSLGAVGAALAAAGTSLVIPPLGIAVAGPLAAALAGGGAGAAAGGLVGALAGAGMSEYRATRFKELIADGKLIVGAEASTEAERTDLEEQLREHGGTVVEEEPTS